MAFDGANCPEDTNSTDCLLRSLLSLLNDERTADHAEINWDPISFWVTFFIGVIATMFALVTILQAVVAAGKGRRKTNSRAIGEWHKRTKNEWMWSEMSFRSTAWTPILSRDLLDQRIEQERALSPPGAPERLKQEKESVRGMHLGIGSRNSLFLNNFQKMARSGRL
ncbi:hypothetical protein CKAH01_10506 [Colletotrichum kahawae]|uniref:Uncharacterized protein n=1 Tax=Colletotrichum kahawae TaxID=34407 RepID=A0AAD9XY94_COLKA|nr:hypothetical protein CKAH01_10506 [Colletotrichum kahawae]